MAIVIAIWGYARTKLYGKRWNIANALLACGMVMAIFCITIMGRTTMYANSEDFQVLAITTMVSSFVAEWNDQNMKLHHKKGAT